MMKLFMRLLRGRKSHFHVGNIEEKKSLEDFSFLSSK